MIEKLGPGVLWALYLAVVRMAAPGILPFLFWIFLVLLAMYVMWLGWLGDAAHTPVVPQPKPHHSPLTGGQCFGQPKFLEYRKFRQGDVEIFEVTRQCPACRMMFFEKKPAKAPAA